jgi:hypothetical protein
MDALPEPRRSRALRSARIKVLADYRADLSRYREVVRALHRYRANFSHEEGPRCAEVHQSVSLKHNHLANDLAHLRTLAILLDKQRDLFDF